MIDRVHIDYIPETGDVIVLLPNGWKKEEVNLEDDSFIRLCLYYLFKYDSNVRLSDDAKDRFLKILSDEILSVHQNSSHSEIYDTISVIVKYCKPINNE